MSDVRLRRSSAQVRDLMLDAAQRLFHRKGFDATSTREISTEAGVSESMLFRHFGSKQAIFEETVLQPFVTFVQSFVSDWTRTPATAHQPEQLARSYVGGFYELCCQHLDLIGLMSTNGSRPSGDTPDVNVRSLIREQLDALATQLGRHHTEAGSQPGLDPQLSVRLTIAMVVGAAQLGEEFFDVGDSLASEIAAFVVRGTRYQRDEQTAEVVSDRAPKRSQRANP